MSMKRSVADAPLRVAAYCRVSTDKEDQKNSLAAQREFFLSYIKEHPGWSLVGVFADEGLSGTSTQKRPQFTEMVRQAMEGEIDLVLTKEVSRFARNTVDTLQITRQLKAKGVAVRFLNDGIDTRESDGEFRLTIMASVAQEESRKVSERTRWGQLQAMRRGVVFGNDSIYGYDLRGGQLTVDPDQAQVVRRVFHQFLTERKGAHTIARELTQDGIPPPLRPAGPWSSTMVLKMLRNEKYTGDLLQKKYRTTDHLTHRKIPNDGTEEQFWIREHHEAIVSREEFQAVQAEQLLDDRDELLRGLGGGVGLARLIGGRPGVVLALQNLKSGRVLVVDGLHGLQVAAYVGMMEHCQPAILPLQLVQGLAVLKIFHGDASSVYSCALRRVVLSFF